MPRRTTRGQYLEINWDGWLFDPSVMQRYRDAVAEGIEELGDEGAGIMASVMANAGLVLTGRTLRSIDSEFRRAGRDTTGYAKVQPTDTWHGEITLGVVGRTKKGKARMGVTSARSTGSEHRPTLTWLDRGTRGGIKLTKSGNLFSRTTNALNNVRTEFMVNKLVEALGGS